MKIGNELVCATPTGPTGMLPTWLRSRAETNFRHEHINFALLILPSTVRMRLTPQSCQKNCLKLLTEIGRNGKAFRGCESEKKCAILRARLQQRSGPTCAATRSQ